MISFRFLPQMPGGAQLFRRWQTDQALKRWRSPEILKR